jgi:hypothetical protein
MIKPKVCKFKDTIVEAHNKIFMLQGTGHPCQLQKLDIPVRVVFK